MALSVPDDVEVLTKFPSTNYGPNSIDSDDEYVYMGGDFRSVGDSSGPANTFSAITGAVVPGFPRISEKLVEKVISDNAGGWYVAVKSSIYDGAYIKLLHIEEGGAVIDLTEGVVLSHISNPSANSLVVDDSYLYVGGHFSVDLTGEGDYVNNLIRIDKENGSIDSGFNFGINSDVYDLALNGNTLYVGGRFSDVEVGGGQKRTHIFALNTTTGTPLSVFNVTAFSGIVYDLEAVSGDDGVAGLFVIGDFVGPNGSRNIAKLDLITGASLNGEGEFWVDTEKEWDEISRDAKIAYSDGFLYISIPWIAPVFVRDDGETSFYCVVRINAVTGELDEDFRMDEDAFQDINGYEGHDILAFGTNTYLAGDYIICNEEDCYDTPLVKINNNAQIVHDPFDSSHIYGYVKSLAHNGNTLLIGGEIELVNAGRAVGVARLNKATGELDEDFFPDLTDGGLGRIASIRIYDGYLYIAGYGLSYGENDNIYLSRINLSTGMVDEDFTLSDGDFEVYSLAASGDWLYLGGAGGYPLRRVRIAGEGIGEVDDTFEAFPDTYDLYVSSLLVHDNYLYASGGGDEAATYFRVNLDTGTLDEDFTREFDGWMGALLVQDNYLYVGGEFTMDEESLSLFRVSLVDNEIDTGFNYPFNAFVGALAAYNNYLYIGGGDESTEALVRLNLLDGSVDPNFQMDIGGEERYVSTLHISDNILFVGGTFDKFAGLNQKNFAALQLEGPEVTPTPTPEPSSTSSSPSLPASSSCSDPEPPGVPDLFQITTTLNTAKLNFTPVSGVSKYYISYSRDQGAEEYGVEVDLGSEGVQNYTINLLSSGTTYYFKVRGQNGCTPGKWSNIKSATTALNIPQTLPTPTATPSAQIKDQTSVNTNGSAPQIKGDEEVGQQNLFSGNHDLLIRVVRDGNPLVGASVELHSDVRYGITDENGEIFFTNVERGEHTLKVAYEDYIAEQKLDVEGETKDMVVQLSIELKERELSSPFIWVMLVLLVVISLLLLFIALRKRRNK